MERSVLTSLKYSLVSNAQKSDFRIISEKTDEKQNLMQVLAKVKRDSSFDKTNKSRIF
jgi:hypothetical protein